MDEKTLKEGGFIKQRQAEFFIVRVKVLAGDATSEQLRKLAEIAEKYGKGWVHLSVRQGVEIPFVEIENFDSLMKELEEVGLSMGACGPRVRVVVACPGSSICPYGLENTKELAKKIDARLYGRGGLPHKFKVGVSGCPSACAKPHENDLGFLGVVEPIFDEVEGKCTSCGLCVETCPTGAITLNEEGKPVIDYSKCSADGRCVSICPTSAIRKKREGWRVFVGGKFGRHPQLGLFFTDYVSDEEALELGEKILSAYKRLGEKGERLRAVIERLGLEKFKQEVLQGETSS